MVMYDSCESSLCEMCESRHQGLEEDGVVAPRGGVDVGVGDVSLCSVSLDIWSCGGEGSGEAMLAITSLPFKATQLTLIARNSTN